MLILGIDPGSRVTGFGLVTMLDNRPRYCDSGCIKTESKQLPERLEIIFKGIIELMNKYPIESVAIEQVFMHQNADSALKLGQARGAAIAAAVSDSLPVSEYSARQIKQAVVGSGKADKLQVQHMVKRILNIQGNMAFDASDALAVAICHGNTLLGAAKMPGVKGVARGRLI